MGKNKNKIFPPLSPRCLLYTTEIYKILSYSNMTRNKTISKFYREINFLRRYSVLSLWLLLQGQTLDPSDQYHANLYCYHQIMKCPLRNTVQQYNLSHSFTLCKVCTTQRLRLGWMNVLSNIRLKMINVNKNKQDI